MTSSYEALRNQAAFLDLSERGKLRLTGEDCARLLHAMSTNDVSHLAPQQSLYAFFLSAQGRILADAYVLNLGDAFWLDTEPELGPKLFEHLDKYIIADDVTMEDETAQYAVTGLEGPAFAEAAQRAGLPVPEGKNGTAAWQDGFVSRAAVTGPDGLRIFLPKASQAELVARLEQAGIPAISLDEAEQVRVENGIPRYGLDISERYLVQETGQMQAVHTNKGCYLGQEIVERVRSRGQVHRHLSRIRIAGNNPPAKGTKLLVGDKEAGEITSAAYSPALGGVVALAYLRIEATLPSVQMTAEGMPARTV